ncbi:MAG: VWA domain-containing protein [Proteobacteria bacterium]|jgi:Ca-activated chloride channel homolog|nr:VWA domain-containing protein [Pseudomonadota bacterium]
MKSIITTLAVALLVLLTACLNQTRNEKTVSVASSSETVKQTVGHETPATVIVTENRRPDVGPDSSDGEAVFTGVLPKIGPYPSYPEAWRVQQYQYSVPMNPGAASNIALAADLSSVGGAYMRQMYAPVEVDSEKYIHFDENGIKVVSDDPVSTFSIDVDTASYSNVRRMLEREGRLPQKDAVKVEEMINYFSYDYPSPKSLEMPFSVITEIARSPWNPDKHLLQIGLKGYQSIPANRPAANLVFLIDVSASMMSNDKLPLVKRSLKLLVNQMDSQDQIALVAYAGAAGLVLDSTPAAERGKIMRAIETLDAGGSTNGGEGIALAYSVATEHFINDGINRVIIASDGDMNVGTVDHEALKNLIERKRESGIALTTLGFGAGNYNYALMEQLADVGNGNAAYIDSIQEAQKVLVNEIQSTLLTIAKDVKIQVEFNPKLVAEYRLIGYENRILNREDFRNDKVDAGDIGAGHTVTAFYEVSLVGSGDTLLPELRYQSDETSQSSSDFENEIAFVKLRFKLPDATSSEEFTQSVLTSSIVDSIDKASPNMQFAASVAGFGQILRGGRFTGQWRLNDVARLARAAKGIDHYGYRSEFIQLVELANTFDSENHYSR